MPEVCYGPNDRLKMKVGDLVFTISPLTIHQKQECLARATISGGDIIETRKSIYLAIKYAVKDVEGLVMADGEPFKLELENGVVSDNSLEYLMNIRMSGELLLACQNFINGIPEYICNPATGEKLHGVELILGNGHKQKTKK